MALVVVFLYHNHGKSYNIQTMFPMKVSFGGKINGFFLIILALSFPVLVSFYYEIDTTNHYLGRGSLN